MALGKRVKERRKEIPGLTQEKLGERVGASQSTIQSIEHRDSSKTDFDEALACELGVTLRWLKTGKGPKFRSDARAINEPADQDGYRVNVDVSQELAILAAILPKLSPSDRSRLMRIVDVFAPAEQDNPLSPKTRTLINAKDHPNPPAREKEK